MELIRKHESQLTPTLPGRSQHRYSSSLSKLHNQKSRYTYTNKLNECKMGLIFAIYLYMYLHLIASYWLYNHGIYLDTIDELPPGKVFPDKCEDFMVNCARVSFDVCREKKIDS